MRYESVNVISSGIYFVNIKICWGIHRYFTFHLLYLIEKISYFIKKRKIVSELTKISSEKVGRND